ARLPESEVMKEYVGDPKQKLMNLMDPANPLMSRVVQNQDSSMQGKTAPRWDYDRVAGILDERLQLLCQPARPRFGLVGACLVMDSSVATGGDAPGHGAGHTRVQRGLRRTVRRCHQPAIRPSRSTCRSMHHVPCSGVCAWEASGDAMAVLANKRCLLPDEK